MLAEGNDIVFEITQKLFGHSNPVDDCARCARVRENRAKPALPTFNLKGERMEIRRTCTAKGGRPIGRRVHE